MITAHEITNYYLYGTRYKPAALDTALMIRGDDVTTQVDIDTREYMTTGPGRFANAVLFEVIDKFFNPSGIAASSELMARSYEKGDLFAAFGISFGGLKLQQYLFDDGKDDLVERSYIWNTTAFQIDPRARFIVGENGDRWIENFAIKPLVNLNSPENFDFDAGDGVGRIANLALEPAIDPFGIGRKVILSFSDEDLPVKTFTYADYNAALSSLVSPNDFNPIRLAVEFPSFVTDLWNGGSTNTIDSDGRVIIYGTNKDDDLSRGKIDELTIIDPMARYFIENGEKGLVFIGGGGGAIELLAPIGTIISKAMTKMMF